MDHFNSMFVTWIIQVQAGKAAASLAPPTATNVADEDEEDEEEYVDVPYTYEVEEIQEQEVMKEEVVERTVPRIKALYAYKGNGMEVAKGEVIYVNFP